MTDRDLLHQRIARIGKEPRAVEFEEDGHLVELNLAGLDLKDLPEEVIALANLRAFWLGHPGSPHPRAKKITANPRV